MNFADSPSISVANDFVNTCLDYLHRYRITKENLQTVKSKRLKLYLDLRISAECVLKAYSAYFLEKIEAFYYETVGSEMWLDELYDGINQLADSLDRDLHTHARVVSECELIYELEAQLQNNYVQRMPGKGLKEFKPFRRCQRPTLSSC